MKNLRRFSDFLSLLEGISIRRISVFDNPSHDGTIPIYNEVKFRMNPKSRPEGYAEKDTVIEAISSLLEKMSLGTIEEIRVTAEIPSQGKDAPKYLVDEIAAEKKRLRDKILDRYGGRIEASDYASVACNNCNSTGKIESESGESICSTCKGKGEIREAPQVVNVFTDTEFIIKGIEKVMGKDVAVGIPLSKKKLIIRNPSLEDHYKTYIQPKQIVEIFFDPY
jgi:hypothetical protein